MIVIAFSSFSLAGQTDEKQENGTKDGLTPLQRVVFKKIEWKDGGFGNVLIANFTIRNNNDFEIKDVTITCEHHAKSGTSLGFSTKTIYDVFSPKKEKTIKLFNMGFMNSQTEKTSCDIVDIASPK